MDSIEVLMIGLRALAAQAKHVEFNSAEDGESERAQDIREGLEALIEQVAEAVQ